MANGEFDPYLNLVVILSDGDELELTLDFKDKQDLLSILVIYLSRLNYIRKYNYKKPKGIVEEILDRFEIPSIVLDSEIITQVKQEWQKKTTEIWKYLELDEIKYFGFLPLKKMITERKSYLWWDIIPPKNIEGIIKALRNISNNRLENFYGLSPEESQQIRNFISLLKRKMD